MSAALQYQIKLASEFGRSYGAGFYKEFKEEVDQNIKLAQDRYEKFGTMLAQLFEHYATGILDRQDYQSIKEEYLKKTERSI